MKIVATNLIKKYRRREVVRDVSIEVSQGEVVGLLGPNGAGKTTTFYMVTGLVRPTRGRVFFDETEVTRWPMYKRARAGVGYLAQESSIFRKLSVEDNIKLVLEMNRVPKAIAQQRIDRLVEDLHLHKFIDKPGQVLSGGERRRAEIARALATEPKFILLDEPFTGIDPVTIEELQAIIQRLKSQGIGILITDHNVSATLSITDRNYILIDGVIQARGSEEEIRSDEHVKRYYLGQGFDRFRERTAANNPPDERDAGLSTEGKEES
ncbi:MAG: LPS export ABC transporter ATP-binding protein [Fimbriimonadaceae bacterium]|jgi:lipopolysaccharide export system ATP-binding protein|nr:LPS export ABC transporter ATP-binding protein [Fimbriimonadaceae bacterium]